MYDKGYVGATQNLGAIRAGLNTVVPPLQQAVAGFSDLVLMVDFDLLEVLTEWNKMPTVEPYVKLDITRYLTIISKLREQGFQLTKEQDSGQPTSPLTRLRNRCGRSSSTSSASISRERPFLSPSFPRRAPGPCRTWSSIAGS